MGKIKICFLGDCEGNVDEGMKKITYNLVKHLRKNNDILVLNPKDCMHINFWRQLMDFSPHIVHYIPGPSLKSFLLMKLVSILLGKKTHYIMSSPLPLLGSVASRFASFLKPDLVLVQSKKSENLFQEMGMITKLVPLSGIDLKTFVPINKMEKEILRQKYNLNTDKFIILHVGHIRHGRNIRLLKKLAKYRDIQIIIIGSTSTGMDDDLYKELIKTDCLIITDYIKKIEEFYQLSDCYLFPTTSVINCIQFPISVLEAMACNIPVITTKFGALYDYFNEEDGLVFIGDGKIDKYVELIKSGSIEVKTRMMVSDFSWENISADLEDIYEQFVCE